MTMISHVFFLFFGIFLIFFFIENFAFFWFVCVCVDFWFFSSFEFFFGFSLAQVQGERPHIGFDTTQRIGWIVKSLDGH
jgi:hypothetical protein